MGVSLLQWLFGMFVTIYLYGRKVPDTDDNEDDDDIEEVKNYL